MTVEDRLRQAMHAEAEQVEVDPQAWAKVQARVGRRRLARTVGASLLGAAALVAGVIGIGSLLADGDTRLDVVPPAAEGSTSTTEPSPGTSQPPPPPIGEPAGAFTGIWPFTSQEAVDDYVADPGVGMFFDAEATALEFARTYLGMPEPVATGEPGPDGGVEVTPRPGSPMTTTVRVVRFGGDEGPYAVVDARAGNILVDRPAPLDVVGTDIEVAGTSTAFEAHVDVEVRQDGQGPGDYLGRSFVMGGANGEMGPFSDTVAIDPPTVATGAVIFSTSSAEDGTLQEATVVRVAFGPPAEGEGEGGATVSVYFHRGEELVEVSRQTGEGTTGVLQAALAALFAGPVPEDGEGLSSLFSAETAGLLAGVNLTPDGTAVVDLAGMVPNASTSTGSRLLLEELDNTVFQFGSVERIEYRLQGSCDAFWTWLQFGGCGLVERPEG